MCQSRCAKWLYWQAKSQMIWDTRERRNLHNLLFQSSAFQLIILRYLWGNYGLVREAVQADVLVSFFITSRTYLVQISHGVQGRSHDQLSSIISTNFLSVQIEPVVSHKKEFLNENSVYLQQTNQCWSKWISYGCHGKHQNSLLLIVLQILLLND